METKEFSTRALASISTGILLCNFSDMHECAEWLMGGSVWTHQFPTLAEEMRAQVLAQFPDLPGKMDAPIKEGWENFATELDKKFGEKQIVKMGDGKCLIPPLAGLGYGTKGEKHGSH